MAGEIRSLVLAGQTVAVEEITEEAPVLFRAMRFNEAAGQWTVSLVVTNQGERAFTSPLYVTVESVSNTTGPITTDGVTADAPVKRVLRIYAGGVLNPGTVSLPQNVALGFVAGAGSPRMQLRVYGVPAGPAYALGVTRTLNEVGQPLPGVGVTERSPQGERVLTTDPDYGVVTLGRSSGEHVWRFERDGFLPVWRRQTLLRGAVRLVPNPRLVRRSDRLVQITSTGTKFIQDGTGALRLDFQFQQAMNFLKGRPVQKSPPVTAAAADRKSTRLNSSH